MTHNIKNPPCPRTSKIHKYQARSNSEDTNKTKTLSSKKQNQIQQPQKTNKIRKPKIWCSFPAFKEATACLTNPHFEHASIGGVNENQPKRSPLTLGKLFAIFRVPKTRRGLGCLAKHFFC